MLKILFYAGIVRTSRSLLTCIVVSCPANRMLLITVNAAVLVKCMFNDFEINFFGYTNGCKLRYIVIQIMHGKGAGGGMRIQYLFIA